MKIAIESARVLTTARVQYKFKCLQLELYLSDFNNFFNILKVHKNSIKLCLVQNIQNSPILTKLSWFFLKNQSFLTQQKFQI